jgi:hypothetical protein
VAFHRGIDGSDPLPPEGAGRLSGTQEERKVSRSSRVATGTLACPGCDAPVAPGPGPLAPADTLRCPFCAHAGAAREFLSLAAPTRPARVAVRIKPVRR